MDSLKTVKNRIRSALKKQGNYSKNMETAISLAAGSYMAFQIALNDLESLECSYVEELTREGNVKLVPHPAFKTLATASEAVRKALRELRLTLTSLDGSTDDDEVDDLVKKVGGINEEE
ncbi:P27 family phage terminase small subunit [Parabacteroides pacaensis]|uniref:P27 family phage terminase small subunit n=1 Tax=Parabacteroides pacaensis TaxID=2086575 RepID=UPI000D102EB6|nr:hypothetical protein [Parabacteroides pacaensis]